MSIAAMTTDSFRATAVFALLFATCPFPGPRTRNPKRFYEKACQEPFV